VVTLPIRQREGPGSTDTRPQADAGVLAAP
jgi:hypothetical protein